MNKRINIIFQSDEKYVPITGVALISLLENNKSTEDIHIYYLSDNIGEASKNVIVELVEQYGRTIEFFDLSQVTSFLQEQNIPMWSGTYATYGRCFAINMLPDEVERVLYIDSDTLINRDISSLYDIDLAGKVCAMVLDFIPDKAIKALKLGDNHYYNAGVMLIDTKRWRELNCLDRIMNEINNAKINFLFADQDLLNIALSGNVKTISPEYNFFVPYLSAGIDMFYYYCSLDKKEGFYTEESINDASSQVVIYHFLSGPFGRPWIKQSGCALTELWDQYLENSPWRGMEKWEAHYPFSVRIQRAVIRKSPWPAVYKMMYAAYGNLLLPRRYSKA